ncbi:unnamed protein product [Closterium sp. NIES-53]
MRCIASPTTLFSLPTPRLPKSPHGSLILKPSLPASPPPPSTSPRDAEDVGGVVARVVVGGVAEAVVVEVEGLAVALQVGRQEVMGVLVAVDAQGVSLLAPMSFDRAPTRATATTKPPILLKPASRLSSSSPAPSPTPSPSSSSHLSHPVVLLHHRLGHPNFTALRTAITSRLLDSLPPTLPPLPSSPAPPCPSFIHGKLKQSPHHSHPTFAAAPLDPVHMDLRGPYPIHSRQGHRYMLVLVDDHSRYSTVFFLHTKDQVPAVVIAWAEQCHTYFKRPISRLHSDGGGEFLNYTLATYCKTHGIQQTHTIPHSSHQNGIAQSRIHEITKIACCLLAHASIPPSLWSYALLHASLLFNLRSHPQ